MTDHPPNHLAAELRGILQDAADTDAHPGVRERLARLAARVEAVDELTTTVTHELTAELSGLTPEQQIRDAAVEHTTRLLARSNPPPPAELVNYAAKLAAWIETGARS